MTRVVQCFLVTLVTVVITQPAVAQFPVSQQADAQQVVLPLAGAQTVETPITAKALAMKVKPENAATRLEGIRANGLKPGLAQTLLAVTEPPGTVVGTPAAVSAKMTLSETGTELASGLVEAFLQKAPLSATERTCLAQDVGELAGGFVGTVAELIRLLQEFIKHEGNEVKLIKDIGFNIVKVVKSEQLLVKKCVNGPAAEALTQAEQHMKNISYIGKHLLANGADVIEELTTSVVAFEHDPPDYHTGGKGIGDALRKVFLANAILPEGGPSGADVESMTDGLITGFFGKGIKLTMTVNNGQPLSIDLHECIADNLEPIRKMWSSVAVLIAKVGSEHREQSGQSVDAKDWMAPLSMVLMELPEVFKHCQLDEEQQQMFRDGIHTLGLQRMRPHLVFPTSKTKATDITASLGGAIKHFEAHLYKQFGEELGEILRELCAFFLPQKYSVDSAGRLRHALLGASAAPQGGIAARLAAQLPGGLPAVGFVAAAMVALGVVAVTRRWALARPRTGRARLDEESDLETPVE